jgi:hypothetical protein
MSAKCWPSLEWWKSLGYTDQGDFLGKSLPNGCEVCISCKDGLPGEPPTDGRIYDIGMYEPDGSVSVLTFTQQRQAKTDPLRMLANILKVCEDEMMA